VEYGARVEILRLRVKEDPIQHRRAQDLVALSKALNEKGD